METSVILNYLLGGGLVAAVIGIVTLKATIRKATADAERAAAEAEQVRIENAEQATRVLINNIIEPLKKELHETREELRETKKELGSTKREMARFRKAFGDANNCKHSDDCPVLHRLRDQPKGDHLDSEFGGHARGQPLGIKVGKSGNGSAVGSALSDTARQSSPTTSDC